MSGQREAGRVLDAEVAERVMGHVLAGMATCIHVEGEWSIHVDSGVDGWACHAEVGPVYVEHCNCADGPIVLRGLEDDTDEDRACRQKINEEYAAEYASDRERFGHSRNCLGVVPEYSTDIAAAWTVVEQLAALGFSTSVEWKAEDRRSPLSAEVCITRNLDEESAVAIAPTAPLAICRAALSALDADKPRGAESPARSATT